MFHHAEYLPEWRRKGRNTSTLQHLKVNRACSSRFPTLNGSRCFSKRLTNAPRNSIFRVSEALFFLDTISKCGSGTTAGRKSSTVLLSAVVVINRLHLAFDKQMK